MKRHIIIADVHGQFRLLHNALKHSNFKSGVDKLVFAGDWCDIGKETAECWEVIDNLATTILMGNHESAHLCGNKIKPYDSHLDYSDQPAKWRKAWFEGRIQIAHVIGDIIITHAGVGNIDLLHGLSLRHIANILNDPTSL